MTGTAGGGREEPPSGADRPDRRLRVIQWTLGNVGRYALAAIADHPDLELVGCYVYDPSKAGHDAGALCGRSPVGVTTTHDVDELLALGADCVSYMPFTPDLDELEAILRSGANVVSTAGFLTGTRLSPEWGRRIDDAARRGGVSCLGTGINPGYINQVCVLLASACRTVSSVYFRESADCSTYAAPEMWRVLGFGAPPPEPGKMAPPAEQLTNQFFEAIDLMADSIGLRCDAYRSEVDYALAHEDFTLPWMDFPAGTVAGQRSRWVASADGADVITAEVIWRMSGPLQPEWPLTEGYQIRIEGDPPLDVHWGIAVDRIPSGHQPSDYLGGALLATAVAAVNAIPAVCAAPAGLRHVLELAPRPGPYRRPGPPTG